MTHQTGIKPNEALKNFFKTCQEHVVRAVKILINQEEISLSNVVKNEVNSTWETYFDKIITDLVKENQPCYIMYRLDTKVGTSYQWLFISWSPDTSPIREKMLYASTKVNLKKELWSTVIKEELHGTTLSEISLDTYKKSFKRTEISKPEQEINATPINYLNHSLGKVGFPITETAKEGVSHFMQKKYNYLQFRIDSEKERIELTGAENISVENLLSKILQASGRYHLFNFRHKHGSDLKEYVVFIYYIQEKGSTIREKILFSTCKNPFCNILDRMGLKVQKRLEIDSDSKISEKFLCTEVCRSTDILLRT
ncbi:hypothetical protein FQR65_LT15376 [Abscondita terminalis]|nr:hypothetical protein FQR65_LT15376 [Abscondita terminalis]